MATMTLSPYRIRKKSDENPGTSEQIVTNTEGKGIILEIHFQAGKHHNHPLMAIWIEDTAGNYLQSLYVAQSIAKGYFAYGDKTSGRWLPGEIRRPAALPYWAHKRGLQAEDGLYIPSSKNPLPDAYSGATPKADFILTTKTDNIPNTQFIRVLMEINQTWDWNEYWTNNKYPDNDEYKTSSQPAIVYAATIDINVKDKEYELIPIGHSHYSGDTGELFPNLSTLTTALHIAKSIRVKVK